MMITFTNRALCFLSIIVIGRLLSSCVQDTETKLRSAYWVYVSDNYDTAYWTNTYIKFSENTLRISGLSTLKYSFYKGNIHVYPSPDTSELKKQLFGRAYNFRIITLTKDSLILISANGETPFYNTSQKRQVFQDTIRFVNFRSIKEKPAHFQKISVATSTCYGSCPELLAEVTADGKINMKCGSYCLREGEFTAQLSAVELQLLQRRIGKMKLIHDSIGFPTPTDAPDLMLIIRKDNNRHVYFGTEVMTQNQLYPLLHDLLQLSETTTAIKTNNLTFEAKIPSYPPTPIDFIGPKQE